MFTDKVYTRVYIKELKKILYIDLYWRSWERMHMYIGGAYRNFGLIREVVFIFA